VSENGEKVSNCSGNLPGSGITKKVVLRKLLGYSELRMMTEGGAGDCLSLNLLRHFYWLVSLLSVSRCDPEAHQLSCISI